MDILHHVLNNVVDYTILLFEFMGVCVLILTGIKGALSYIQKNPYTRLNLAKGMAMGLEFKLGGEILRTVVVRTWKEILTVAGIIALRASLTLLIHWGIKNEEAQHENAELLDKQHKDSNKIKIKNKVNGLENLKLSIVKLSNRSRV